MLPNFHSKELLKETRKNVKKSLTASHNLQFTTQTYNYEYSLHRFIYLFNFDLTPCIYNNYIISIKIKKVTSHHKGGVIVKINYTHIYLLFYNF